MAGKKTIMNTDDVRCVVLADRHHGLSEGLRRLLETAFEAVVMVADEASLFESARRLQPMLVVVDLSLPDGRSLQSLRRLRACCPATKIIVISVHDEPSVGRSVMEAGADAFVLKRDVATELMPAVDAVLSGQRYCRLVGLEWIQPVGLSPELETGGAGRDLLPINPEGALCKPAVQQQTKRTRP